MAPRPSETQPAPALARPPRSGFCQGISNWGVGGGGVQIITLGMYKSKATGKRVPTPGGEREPPGKFLELRRAATEVPMRKATEREALGF